MNKFSIESIVSKNVKYLRKQLGWSQELLAEKTEDSSEQKLLPVQNRTEKKSLNFSVLKNKAKQVVVQPAFSVQYVFL